MTELADVHRAVADVVRDNVDRDFNVAAFPFSHMPLPRIEVWPSSDDVYVDPYGESDDDEGMARVRLRLKVDIDTADGETAFNYMSELLTWDGPSSLRAAVMDDRTLRGVVDDVVVGPHTWETDDDNEAQTAWVPVDIFVQK